jgi:lia operon protein LiaG
MRNWIVIALILLVVGLIGMFGTFRGENWRSFGTEKVELKRSLDASGLNHVHMETNSMDLKVVPTTSKEITATLSGSASKKYIGKLRLVLEREGDTVNLSVEDDVGFTIGFNILNVEVKLELPEQQWKSVILDSSSGTSEITKLSADSITLEGKSGNMDLSGLNTNSLAVKLTSGNVDIMDVDAGTTTIEVRSGNVALNNLKGDKLKADVTSGNIKLEDVDAKLQAEATSGNIRAELQALNQPMEFKTTSGNVTLMSDNKPEAVQIKFHTSSGNLNNDWEDAQKSEDGNNDENLIFDAGGPVIVVNTSSGNFSIGER